MSQNLGSLSFLSRFDPSEFYEIARDLPSTFELNEPMSSGGSNDGVSLDEQNFQIIGTHLLVPENSISKMLQANPEIVDSTIIDFDSLANLLPANEVAIPATCNLPSYETFFGPYNFRINISSTEIPVKKSASWTYSSKLNKLYSIPGVACPVEISVSPMPPFGTIVRAVPVFSKFEHIQDLVTRCENHKKGKDFQSDDFPDEALSHFVRCRHPQACYTQDMSSLRESVCIPFERPTTGSNSTTVLYQFMCYSSCIGGSQKPARVVLTLENNGEVLGRNSFEVKICACPGRDRTTDEKKLNNGKDNLIKSEQKVAKINQAVNGVAESGADKKRKLDQISIKSVYMPTDEGDEEIFTLKVRGKKNYEILKNLNEALEIQSRIYSKMRTSKLNESSGLNSRVMTRGSSFIFSNNDPAVAKNNKTAINNDTNQNIPNNLEEFLEQADLIAYYNLISSKGIKSVDDLVSADKKKINGLKISQKDTTKLQTAIHELKARIKSEQNEKNKQSPKRAKLDDQLSGVFSFRQASGKEHENENASNYVKLSKYQIRCSFKN